MNLGLLKELATLPFAKRAPKAEYEETWKKPMSNEPRPFSHNGKQVMLTRKERIESIVSYLAQFIDEFQPQDILEVGSGRGDIIAELAKRYPQKHFRALELTDTGVRNHPALPNLTVLQGDMRNITALSAATVDFVYSHLAVEQLPDDYLLAFKEIRRILRPAGHVVFMEEFKEFQSFTQRLYLQRRNLFCAPSSKLAEAGFKIRGIGLLPYQKYRYTTAAALVEPV